MKFSIAQKCALVFGVSAGLGGLTVAAECDSVAEEVTKAVSEKPNAPQTVTTSVRHAGRESGQEVVWRASLCAQTQD